MRAPADLHPCVGTACALEQSDVAEVCPATIAPHTVVSCGIDPGKSVFLSLPVAQPKDVVLLRTITTQTYVYTIMRAPGGAVVTCQTVGSVFHCPTFQAGTYSLELKNSSDHRSDISASYYALLSSTACKAVGATDHKLGAPTVFHEYLPLGTAGGCYTLDLAVNDMLRSLSYTYAIARTVYDGAGHRICSEQGNNSLNCRLTGVAPFRVALSPYDVAADHDLSFARLSKPEGCVQVEPQAFGTSPASTVPCRVLRAAESAPYRFGPVVSDQYYEPTGQLFAADGSSVSTDCAHGSCDLASGDYTWLRYSETLAPATPFGMAFHSTKETRGCAPTPGGVPHMKDSSGMSLGFVTGRRYQDRVPFSASERAHMFLTPLRVAACTALAAGLITGAGPSEAAPPAVEPGECLYNPAQEAGAPKNLGTPPVQPAYRGTVRATLKTNRGDITMALDAEHAPCTVNSFTFLAKKNFFDKTDCHRLSVGTGLKMLQCGDPTGSGSGGPGYQFANENTEGATYPKGTIAMANSGPDTNGSQFFLVFGDSQLSPDYTVFGKIISGIDLLEKVGKAGDDGSSSAGGGKPKMKVEIEDATIANR